MNIFDVLIFYFLGYLAGYFIGKRQDIKEVVRETTNKISDKISSIKPTIKVGKLVRPSARDLLLRRRSQKEKEGDQAVKESLDAIPELQEHKRKLAEFSKSNKGIYD